MEHDNDIKKFIYAGLLGVVVFGFSISHAYADVQTHRDWSEAFSQGTYSSVTVSATSSFFNSFEPTSTIWSVADPNMDITVAITSGLSADAVSSVTCDTGGGNFTRINHGQTSGNRWLSVWDIHLTSTSTCDTWTINNTGSEFTGAVWSIHIGTQGIGNSTGSSGTDIGATSTLFVSNAGSALIQIGQWYPTPGGNPYASDCAYNGVAIGICQNTNQFDAGNQTPGNVLIADNTEVRSNNQLHINAGNNSVNTHYNSGSDPYALVAFVLEKGASGGGSGNTSVNFISPVDNATGVDPKFLAWDTQYHIVSSNHISASTNGQILVKYSKCSDFSCGIIYDRAPLFTTSSELLVVKSNDLILSKDWYAYLELYDYTSSTALFGNFIASSSIIHFQVNQDLSLYPPGFGGNFISPSSTMATSSAFYVDCTAYDNQPFFSSATIPGIFCLTQKTLYSFAGWLIIPPDWAGHDLKDAYNFSGLFPFNFIFGIRDNISASSLWTGTTYQVSTANIPDVSLGIFGSSTTLLSSSTLVSLMTTDHCDHTCAVQNKDTAFSFLRTVIWIGGIIRMITIII